jgi:hypothetical protein
MAVYFVFVDEALIFFLAVSYIEPESLGKIEFVGLKLLQPANDLVLHNITVNFLYQNEAIKNHFYPTFSFPSFHTPVI